MSEKKISKDKIEAIEKYGEDGIYELKIRDSKTDPTLFYLINAIDKDIRAEACREILKRALTDIYFGLNETELVKQEDLVNYLAKSSKAKVPTKQWLFSTGASNIASVENNILTRNTIETKTEPIIEETTTVTVEEEDNNDQYEEHDNEEHIDNNNDTEDSSSADECCCDEDNDEDDNEQHEEHNNEDDNQDNDDAFANLIGEGDEAVECYDDDMFSSPF